jgi:hypothetical protein
MLKDIQRLMGHAHISTSLLYLQLAKVKILQVKNPLDWLQEKDDKHEDFQVTSSPRVIQVSLAVDARIEEY